LRELQRTIEEKLNERAGRELAQRCGMTDFTTCLYLITLRIFPFLTNIYIFPTLKICKRLLNVLFAVDRF